MTSKDRVSFGIVVSVAALAVTIPLVGKPATSPQVRTTSQITIKPRTAVKPATTVKPVVDVPRNSRRGPTAAELAKLKVAEERRQRANDAAGRQLAARRRASAAQSLARAQALARSRTQRVITAPVTRVVAPQVSKPIVKKPAAPAKKQAPTVFFDIDDSG